MYAAHFGLNAAPFSITPDPHYLYLSTHHREALAHLLYGVNEGPGFILLTGEVGTGKTTLCRCLIEQLPESVDVALITNPHLSPMELLAALFDELKIGYTKTYTLKAYFDTLNSYLLTAHAVGRRTVLILDEAQNLSTEVLEQVRLLTNLETASRKLLQIILVGQPELQVLLKRNDLRQLAQRITARYHLLPLSLKDTQAYIRHRLAVSGAPNPLFTKAAMRLVHRSAGGIPRLVNVICDRALLGGYVKSKYTIDVRTVREAVKEVRGETPKQRPSKRWVVGSLLSLLLLGGITTSGWLWWVNPPKTNTATPRSTVRSLSLPASTLINPVETTPPLPNEQQADVPPPPLTLLSLLEAEHIASDAVTAFTTLFRYWQLDYQQLVGETACERAATQALACFSKAGQWEDIRYLNRPVIFELVTEAGEQHHMVINRLEDETATLDFGGKIFEFSIAEINERWLGQFLLLWRPPALSTPLLKVGMSHEAVIWVKKHLDYKEGHKTLTVSALFDRALKQRVMAFQQQQHLTVDGLVGEKTLLALQAWSREGPTLLVSPTQQNDPTHVAPP